MDQIFTLPSTTGFSPWVDTNDAETELSEIQVTATHCIVPQHIYKDSLLEDEYLDKLVIDNDMWVLYPRHVLNYIQATRGNSYRACIWYPELINKIPTAPSILLYLTSMTQLWSHLKDNIAQYPFVRLCTMSPKDRKTVPLYDSTTIRDAVKDITHSQRTKNLFSEPYCDSCSSSKSVSEGCDENLIKGKHLFMREQREYEWEARCFWSRDKLRAVSLPVNTEFTSEDKKEIINFFERYGKHIPYHSAVVDIAKTDDAIELIEFNTFGPDMKATAGNFSWYEDVMTLVHAPAPVFR